MVKPKIAQCSRLNQSNLLSAEVNIIQANQSISWWTLNEEDVWKYGEYKMLKPVYVA